MANTNAAFTRPGHVLVADDDEDVRHYSRLMLQRNGFTCDCASDADEATRLLASRDYDLLISDIQMPGNQELEFIRSVSKLRAGLPVILITGYPSLPTAMQAIHLPVFAYLVKPINFDELMRQVQKGLAFHRVSSTLHGVTDRLRGWIVDTDHIRKEFEASPQATVKGTFFGAMTLTMGKMADTLLDLQELFKLAVELDPGHSIEDALPNSPRMEALEKALMEGIQVLEASKDTYRSKELGALRRRFEALLPPKP